MKRVEIRVRGRVQGVGFRAFIARAAETLSLTGTVENKADGTVSIIAEGDDMALERLVESAKEGPRLASVDTIDHDYFPTRDEFNDFSIIG